MRLRRSHVSGSGPSKVGPGGAILLLTLALLIVFPSCVGERPLPEDGAVGISDHFDGSRFFNPQPAAADGRGVRRTGSRWVWRWIFGEGFPEWPDNVEVSPAPPPPERVPEGFLRITVVGHSTFLIQMDGLNILTDPIWSDRCGPVSWVGPRRRQKPGLRFEDLPPVDVVLVSHNHYDHLDLPTLRRLADRGVVRSVAPLGNRKLVESTGFTRTGELDWWQSIRLSPKVTVTLVPAQHFSARTLWDRDRTLWGGFVISGPSGNVFYAGDTGYGPHFREIARRFSPIRIALLPIAPFKPPEWKESPPRGYVGVHMGPEEAVRAHLDLGSGLSIAAHFRVFRLGWDGFDDAVKLLAASAAEKNLGPEEFLALAPGRSRTLNFGRAGVRPVVPAAYPAAVAAW